MLASSSFHQILLWSFIAGSTAEVKLPPEVKVLDRAYTHDEKYFQFATRPDIQAPAWNIELNNKSLTAPGLWFIAPYEVKTQEVPGDAWVGPHIYDSNGDLVWSGTPFFGHWNVFDFGAEDVNGRPHLTGLEWHEQRGVVLDSSYQLRMTAASVAENDTFQNMHGFHVVDNGQRALVQTVRRWNVPREISLAQVGYDGICEGHYQGFLEYELDEHKPGRVLFDWDGRKIGLNESTYRQRDAQKMCADGWDLLHVNAVDKCPDGDFLLSARHTDALYKISHTTGDIVWRLGGVMSDFELGEGAKFSRQHHCRCQAQNETHTIVTLFDNAVGEHFQAPTRQNSRGLVLALDMQKKTAEVSVEYENPYGFLTDGRGSFQVLRNGNAFLNWAVSSRISEHTNDGQAVLKASLKSGIDTYRAFKSKWVGRPIAPPDVHAEIEWREHRENGEKLTEPVTVVSMSWNGATEVDHWDVSGFDGDGQSIQLASKVPRQGFETAIEYHGFATNVFARAYSSKAKLLGTSSSGAGEPVTPSYSVYGHKSVRTAQWWLFVGGIALAIAAAVTGIAYYWWRRNLRRGKGSVEGKGKGEYQVVGQDDDT